MKTYMAHAENVVRKWYVVDAEGLVLGRLASKVAAILRGKNKPTFTPNVDCGDFVIVINAEKAILTGNKLNQKYYRTHSGYVGGLKEVPYRILMQEKPELALELAVKGMIPRNVIGRKALDRLKVFAGAEHCHAVDGLKATAKGTVNKSLLVCEYLTP